jgi:hypothetical protein
MDHNTMVFGYAGYFKAEAYNPDTGERRLLQDWKKNLITNGGMDRLTNGGTGSFYNTLRVGSGSTTPAFTDTALVAHVASVAGATPTYTEAVPTDPAPYVKAVIVYTFAVGAAAGNLTELGLAPALNLAGNPLTTRALFQDSGGNPTTITVASDEQLVVTYELRCYLPATPAVAVLTNPADGVNYTISVLPARIGINMGFNSMLASGVSMGNIGGTASGQVYYGAAAGSLGGLNGVPTGTSATAVYSASEAAYVAGTYYKDISLTFGLTSANYAQIGGFSGSTASSAYYAPCIWQWTISPKVDKTNVQNLRFTFRMAVARA